MEEQAPPWRQEARTTGDQPDEGPFTDPGQRRHASSSPRLRENPMRGVRGNQRPKDPGSEGSKIPSPIPGRIVQQPSPVRRERERITIP